MSARAQIVLSLQPASGSAVLSVTGPLPAGSADEVREVVHRAAGLAGARVCVDLRECEHMDPAVLACLTAAGRDLRARGGFLVCRGLTHPAGAGDVVDDDGSAGLDGSRGLDGWAQRGRGAADAVALPDGVLEPGRGAEDEADRPLGSLATLPDGDLAGRIGVLVRRRAEAWAEPERSTCGQELVDLLVEAGRRRARTGLCQPSRLR